jgi:hypothetical protein
VETCNMRPFHPPLRLSIFYGSRDQRPPGSLLPKSKYPGNEVAILPVSVKFHAINLLILKMQRHQLAAILAVSENYGHANIISACHCFHATNQITSRFGFRQGLRQRSVSREALGPRMNQTRQIQNRTQIIPLVHTVIRTVSCVSSLCLFVCIFCLLLEHKTIL